MQEWHFVRKGAQAGPVTFEELRRMAAAGELDRADTVWKPGMTTWTQAGSVEGLFPAQASAPLDYGGFGIRFAARAVDGCACVFFGLVGGLGGGIILGVMKASGRIDADALARLHDKGPAAFFFSLGAMFFYHAVSEGMGGSTMGKLLCRLRVTAADGSPTDMTSAVIRSAAFFLDSLFFGLVAYGKMSKNALQQRYGDAWAGTVVVKAESVPEASRRSTGAIVLAIILGAGGAVLLDLTSLLWKVLR